MRTLTICFFALAAGCGTANPAADQGALPDATTLPDLATASMCTVAVEQLLAPIDMVSNGAIIILSDSAGVKTVYLDASAGGLNAAGSHPRLYVDLATAKAVAVTDKTARASTDWDLALKRPVLFTNDGDGGPGKGGALSVGKAFDQVTAADAGGQSFATEMFVDQDCNPLLDPTGSVLTTMSDWYDYDLQTNLLAPKPNTTWVVRGGKGALFKVAIDDYYAAPDGSHGMTGGHFLLKIGAL